MAEKSKNTAITLSIHEVHDQAQMAEAECRAVVFIKQVIAWQGAELAAVKLIQYLKTAALNIKQVTGLNEQSLRDFVKKKSEHFQISKEGSISIRNGINIKKLCDHSDDSEDSNTIIEDNPTTVTDVVSPLDRNLHLAVEHFVSVIKIKGPMEMHRITGHINQAPGRQVVWAQFDTAEQFLRKMSNVFTVESDVVSLVKKKPGHMSKQETCKPPSNQQTISGNPGNLDESKQKINFLESSDECINFVQESNKNTTTKTLPEHEGGKLYACQGYIARLLFNSGFINYSSNVKRFDNVYFSSSVCEENIWQGLDLEDKVCFNAVLNVPGWPCKWKATKVWLSSTIAEIKSVITNTKYDSADIKSVTTESKCTTAEIKSATDETKCYKSETKYATAKTKATTPKTKYATAKTKANTPETKYATAKTKATTPETKYIIGKTKVATSTKTSAIVEKSFSTVKSKCLQNVNATVIKVFPAYAILSWNGHGEIFFTKQMCSFESKTLSVFHQLCNGDRVIVDADRGPKNSPCYWRATEVCFPINDSKARSEMNVKDKVEESPDIQWSDTNVHENNAVELIKCELKKVHRPLTLEKLHTFQQTNVSLQNVCGRYISGLLSFLKRHETEFCVRNAIVCAQRKTMKVTKR